MASKHRIVEFIRDNIEFINWHPNSVNGGFSGHINDVAVHITGGHNTRIVMTITADHEDYVIVEPLPLQDAPLGKIVKFVNTKILKRQIIHEPEVQADMKLKQMLKEILGLASKHCVNRYKDLKHEMKLRQKIWFKLTDKDPF